MRGLHGLPARHGASCLREIPICFFCSQGTVTCYVRHAGGEWPARDELPWVGWSGLQKLRIHTLHTVRYTVPTATNVICSFFFLHGRARGCGVRARPLVPCISTGHANLRPCRFVVLGECLSRRQLSTHTCVLPTGYTDIINPPWSI
jgi:hypothetical protein